MLSFRRMETNPKLILASGSPRRAELLRSSGIDFEVRRPEADEIPRAGEVPAEFTERTAREKAASIQLNADEIILAADTIVTIAGTILGKPADENHAGEMLRLLAGNIHEVITGVCLRAAGKVVSFSVSTAVEFRKLADDEIVAYIKTGEPLDKAGAYAIQGGAAGMVRKINGSYSNVVGLPLCEVIEAVNGLTSES